MDGNPTAAPGTPPSAAPPSEVAPVSVARSNAPPRRADWLDRHLDAAAAFWTGQADAVRATHPALATQMEAISSQVPARGELAPPLPEVVVLLNEELELYDAMKAAGVDVSEVESELSGLLQAR